MPKQQLENMLTHHFNKVGLKIASTICLVILHHDAASFSDDLSSGINIKLDSDCIFGIHIQKRP